MWLCVAWNCFICMERSYRTAIYCFFSNRYLQFVPVQEPLTYKIGKVYCLEYTDIPKVLFSPHHVGHCCTVVWGRWWARCVPTMSLGLCYTNLVWCHCATMCSINDLASQCYAAMTLVMRVAYIKGETRQTGRHWRPIWCSLTLEREEYSKTEMCLQKQNLTQFYFSSCCILLQNLKHVTSVLGSVAFFLMSVLVSENIVFEGNMAMLSSLFFHHIKKVLRQTRYMHPLQYSFSCIKRILWPLSFITGAKKNYFLKVMLSAVLPAQCW
jgi:hypothetical protein